MILPPGKSFLVVVVLLIIVPLFLRVLGVHPSILELTKDVLGVVAAEFEKGTEAGRKDACADATTHWKSTEQIGTAGAFEDHLARFPNCEFATLARMKIKQLEAAKPPADDCELVQNYKHLGPNDAPPPTLEECERELLEKIYK